MHKPTHKPARPFFSAGPCVRPLSWIDEPLNSELIHRSHRSIETMAFIKGLGEKIRRLLKIPQDYVVCFVPGSGTGAMDALIYNLLGQRPVDIQAFEVFSHRWAEEVVSQLGLAHQIYEAPFGEYPACSHDPTRDLLCVLNGTTSGVYMSSLDWIAQEREGLVLADGVSDVWSRYYDWSKIDGLGFSWQKTLGAEAGLGTLVLSPRALARLEQDTPLWPVPFVIRLRGQKGLRQDMRQGGVISTPSLLTLDALGKALTWVEDQGGISGLQKRIEQNVAILSDWVRASAWCDFFVKNEAVRSSMVVTLQVKKTVTWDFLGQMATLLREEKAAFDILNHPHAPPTIRVWCGPTVEKEDLSCLCLWLDWAYAQIQSVSPS